MNTKKVVFFTALIVLGFIFVIGNPIMFGFCKNIIDYGTSTKYCNDGDILSENIQQLSGFLSLVFLLFSLITYRMKEEVFRTWWNFARRWTVIIIVATFLLENAGGGGGWGISSGIFEVAILWLLYIIFIVVSLYKIARAYRKTLYSKK